MLINKTIAIILKHQSNVVHTMSYICDPSSNKQAVYNEIQKIIDSNDSIDYIEMLGGSKGVRKNIKGMSEEKLKNFINIALHQADDLFGK